MRVLLALASLGRLDNWNWSGTGLCFSFHRCLFVIDGDSSGPLGKVERMRGVVFDFIVRKGEIVVLFEVNCFCKIVVIECLEP